MLAIKEPRTTGRRLVPLAMAGGSPKNISRGSVTADPLDATVLKNPQRNPATKIARISSGVCILANFN
jgi:hypothetical protein